MFGICYNIFLLIYLVGASDSGSGDNIEKADVSNSSALDDQDSESNMDREKKMENKMENTHVRINHEMENMILDQIDSKLADLEVYI